MADELWTFISINARHHHFYFILFKRGETRTRRRNEIFIHIASSLYIQQTYESFSDGN